WGGILLGIVVLGAISYILLYRKGKEYLVRPRFINSSLLCMLMLMIGYSSYAIIVIRSTANTPMDQNSPEDIFTLGQYLGREQYGSTPLFYGKAYNSQLEYEDAGDGYMKPKKSAGANVYQRKEKTAKGEKDFYEVNGDNGKYLYAQNMIFPRMHDSQYAHAYEDWMGGIEGYQVPFEQNGQQTTIKMPTQLENMKFFFSYQLNFMYWRYFMWNFAGRQNDIQSNGELEHGNWITGISWFDNWRLGDQSQLPSDLKQNKGHNVFFMLPLLLGIIGLFWQAYRGDKGVKQFWVVFFLFFMTGIAIVLYLNQTPSQPRERDYAYAASFYAFAIWCGMGVAAIAKGLERLKLGETPAAALATVACVLVPIQMCSQTWDDHDRSNRYTCRDFGQNYLMSLQAQGNPILFTNGDNDTFPLWYNQETEGFRTDVRVCNLSYLQTDWYIDQMKRPAYNSPAVPITWSRAEYVSGKNEFIQIRPDYKEQILKLYAENPQQARETFGDNPFELKNILKNFVRNPELACIPTDSIFVKIDKNAVRRSGMKIVDSIPDYMVISLTGKNAVYKSELMMYEMLAECNWTRPLYVATTVGSDNWANMGDYFMQEGLVYRITPFKVKQEASLNVDTDKMYDNLMNKFKFGGINNPKIYLDETVSRMCYTHRRMFAILASQLLVEGKKEKALNVLAYCEKMIPSSIFPHGNMMGGSFELARAWILASKPLQGQKMLKEMAEYSKEYLSWYLCLNDTQLHTYSHDCMYHLDAIYRASSLLIESGDSKDGQNYQKLVEKYAQHLNSRGVSLRNE
ncbi:MAG: hypothetical protein RR386_08535, partial [Bacteroidaceae bacterium]